MPITLVTGLPGNGKTLFALSHTKERAERENRPVYYSGIKDLKLPWIEIDPEKWYDVPSGSIVVIDEGQRVFRPRMHGKEVPVHVAELETHRHKGIDLVLITQHPMLADNAIRRLTDRHMHVMRVFGAEAATIHEWNSVRENCEKPAGRVDSQIIPWKYPKEVYTWYHSAEVHTVKRRIPPKLIMLCILPFILAALIWRLYSSVQSQMKPAPVDQKPVPAGMQSMTAMRGDQASAYQNPVEDAKRFVFERTPRLQGVVHTAPLYDDLTKPTRVPVPAACVVMNKRCQCYTQQGTKLHVGWVQCLQIVQDGFFEEFPRDRESSRREDARIATNRVQHGDVEPPASSAVVVMDADGYGVLGSRGASASQK
jgi:zona occludens toxin